MAAADFAALVTQLRRVQLSEQAMPTPGPTPGPGPGPGPEPTVALVKQDTLRKELEERGGTRYLVITPLRMRCARSSKSAPSRPTRRRSSSGRSSTRRTASSTSRPR